MKLLHEDAPPSALRLARIVIFGVWFLRVALKPLHEVALIPRSLYQPVGLMRFLPASVDAVIRDTVFLHGLKIAALLCFALVMAGVALRPMMVLSCILMTLVAGLWRGFAGHIDHESILIMLAGYVFTLCALADWWMEKRGKPWPASAPSQFGVPLTAALALLCLVYTLVGVYRLTYGFPTIYTSHSLTFWALRNAYETVDPTWGWGKLVIEYPWMPRFLELGFPVITLFEVTTFAVLFSRWYRYVFLLVMVPFHIMSWFVLDVFFWENMALYLLFFELYRRSGQERSPS